MKNLTYLLLLISLSSVAQSVKVMTYNIRLDVAADGENRWDNRKDFLAAQVLFNEPEFLGVQEAQHHQMQYLDNTLTGYSHIGVGRADGATGGEYSAVFYNSKRFRLVTQSTFWLSPTPEKVSIGWDAAYKRVCTYGLFEEIKTHKKLWVFNTHFDHVGNVARTESARLILQKIKELNKENLPFVLTGDFNLEDTSESIKYILTQLNDSKAVAKFTFGPSGTFNGFKFHEPVTTRIDYIFVPKNNVTVKKYAVLSDSKDCRYPSDHLSVLAELEFR